MSTERTQVLLSQEETVRQYEFIEKAALHVQRLKEELGRQPTCCVTTFGCQMNARDSEKLTGISIAEPTTEASIATTAFLPFKASAISGVITSVLPSA